MTSYQLEEKKRKYTTKLISSIVAACIFLIFVLMPEEINGNLTLTLVDAEIIDFWSMDSTYDFLCLLDIIILIGNVISIIVYSIQIPALTRDIEVARTRERTAKEQRRQMQMQQQPQYRQNAQNYAQPVSQQPVSVPLKPTAQPASIRPTVKTTAFDRASDTVTTVNKKMGKNMYCKHCGAELISDAAFCGACGKKIIDLSEVEPPAVEYDTEVLENPICQGCGAKIQDHVRFCGKCGTERAPSIEIRFPRCVVCDERLVKSSRFCIKCGTRYKSDENGYIELPFDPCCPNCGEELTDDSPFCVNCGTQLPEKQSDCIKKMAPCCPECNEIIDLNGAFCTNCGTAIRGFKPVPLVVGNTISCPVCGEKNMQPNRKFCFKCTVEFAQSPWICNICGRENLYPTTHCSSCHSLRPI